MSTTTFKVAFLIDEQSIMRSTFSVDLLLTCIKRILTFYGSIAANVVWSYCFFSTETSHSCHTRHYFQTLSKEAVQAIVAECAKRSAGNPSTNTPGTPHSRITQLLKEIIGDFQWESNELGSADTSENYAFIVTGCPSNRPQLGYYFFGQEDYQIDDDNDYEVVFRDGDEGIIKKDKKNYNEQTLGPALPYFKPWFEQLKETVFNVYDSSKICVSLIDTTEDDRSIPIVEFSLRCCIQYGFKLLMNKLKGNYISMHVLARDLTMYRHSFLSEIANYIPHHGKPFKYCVRPPSPAWSGKFTMVDESPIGMFYLYPAFHAINYRPFDLACIEEIRMVTMMHVSQFSPSWLVNKTTEETGNGFRLVHQSEKGNKFFDYLLEKLYSTRAVAIAELVPLKGFEELKKKVCIEPYSEHSAYVYMLNDDYADMSDRGIVEVGHADPYTPLGAGLLTKHAVTVPSKDTHSSPQQLVLNTDAPEDVKAMIERLENKRKASAITGSEEAEEEPEELIPLPPNVYMFAKQFKTLYIETLYERAYIMEDFIKIVGTWIDHLLSRGVVGDEIIRTLQNYAISTVDLDLKHGTQFTQVQFLPYDAPGPLELSYQIEWWRSIKDHERFDKEFEELSRHSLRLTEAQLQVILRCFICKLLQTYPIEDINPDPFEAAQSFFVKSVLILSCNKIEDFLTDLDSEEGPGAIARRDPCDLLDLNFAHLLEEKFKDDLSDLVTMFKEAAGDDDLMSIPDDGEEDMFALELAELKRKNIQLPNQLPYIPQLGISASEHTHTSKPTMKPNKKIKLSESDILPAKPSRNNSNPIDLFMKRTISVNPKTDLSAEGRMSDAAKAAIAKINRSMVDGKPTMKRAGSFIKSVNSPKRPKANTYVEGAVTLRKTTRFDPDMTPRTSLNRYLNVDLFADYSEYCVSPSRDSTPAKLVPSEYPRTPQGTSSRYRKTMLEDTPHRNNEDEAEEFSCNERVFKAETSHVSFTDRLRELQDEEGYQSDVPLSIVQRKSKIDSLFEEDSD